MSLKADNRAKQILRILLEQGSTSVDDLIKVLNVSPASVRRDLARLESRGLVLRTHGGVTLAGDTTFEAFHFDASFQIRDHRFAEEKRRIGVAAAQLIKEGQTIGLTAGTTTTQLVRNLRHIANLQVVTNGLNIGMELANQTALRVTLTGGSVRWPGAFSLVGPTALESIEHTFMDKIFLGACGVDPRHGVTTIEPEEALLYRLMVSHAKQAIVLVDSSKIGQISPALTCKISAVHTLVTDDGIAPNVMAAFRDAGVQVIVA
jgi:DeoR family transcriptional regulator, aga operon transcriptional repressor